MIATYNVPLQNVDMLRSRVEELNKRVSRARIRGVAPVTMAEGEPFTVEQKITLPSGRPGRRKVTFVPVTVTGEDITEAGWRFVATLHHEGEGTTLVAGVPGEVVPMAYRWANARCDHCNVQRRRNVTYIIRRDMLETEGSEALIQVGRGCLADFLSRPSRDPHQLAKLAELMGWFSTVCDGCEHDDWGRRGEQSWSLEEWLTATSLAMRCHGWTSRGVAKDYPGLTATSDIVFGYLTTDKPEDRRKDEFISKMDAARSEADEERALKVIEWADQTLVVVEGDERHQLSDYEHNLSIVVRLGIVRRKHMGLAASLIRAWQRATGAEMEQRERKEKGPVSQHLAMKIGERSEAEGVTVLKTMEMEDRGFGASLLVKMRTAEGNNLTWFASRSAEWPKDGEVLNIKFTVKKFGEYNGVKETTVQRVKILARVAAATATNHEEN
jgi:hypothetical protein